MIRSYKGIRPKLGEAVYVDPTAQVIGDVEIGAHSSIWMNVVIRGDVHLIRIGTHTNIQDNCVVHVVREKYPTHIGDHVTVGHGALLHGCRIDSYCLIGMGAIVLSGAHIESDSIVAAGAVIPEGMLVSAGSLVMSTPGKVRRAVTAAEKESIRRHAAHYCAYKDSYLSEPSRS